MTDHNLKHLTEEILMNTVDYCHKCINDEAYKYLRDVRGFADESINKFKIGYDNGCLGKFLLEKNKYPLETCYGIGLLTKDGRDSFHNRITFPNLYRDKTVHITARTINGEQPKYKHIKGEIRYAYNEAVLLNNPKEVFIVEGPTDTISLAQVGYPGIGLFGAGNFNEYRASKLERCSRAYLLLDNDEAGRVGILKIAKLLTNKVRMIQLPEDYDVNSYLKIHTQEDFRRHIASAKDIIQYLLEEIPKDVDRVDLPSRMQPVIEMLSYMDGPSMEAHLERIKSERELGGKDMDGYRRMIQQLKRERNKQEKIKRSELNFKKEFVEKKACFKDLIDLVEADDKPAYLIKEGGKLTVKFAHSQDGNNVIPPKKGQIPFLLPRASEVIGYYETKNGLSDEEIDRQLFNDLVDYFRKVSKLPDERYYYLLAAWVMHTYLLEDFEYSPGLCFYAIAERGKSRTGLGIMNVSYRGITLVSLNEAYIFRAARLYLASIFFDFTDFWGKAKSKGSEDILLGRFREGSLIARVMFPERGDFDDTVYYPVFGATVFASNEPIEYVMESRAISIQMPETRERFDDEILKPINALPLKERLVAFRARHIGKPLPEAEKPLTGRLGDILKPIRQIILMVNPDKEADLILLFKEIERNKTKQKIYTLEARILMSMQSLRGSVENAMLPVKVITDTLNENENAKYAITYQRVGRKLQAMGFESVKTNNGSAAVLWDDRLMVQLLVKYGLREPPDTPETPVS